MQVARSLTLRQAGLTVGAFAAGIIYVLDIVYNFRTAFIVVHNLRRCVVRDPALIAEYYVRHGTFWPDLLAALPIVPEVR